MLYIQSESKRIYYRTCFQGSLTDLLYMHLTNLLYPLVCWPWPACYGSGKLHGHYGKEAGKHWEHDQQSCCIIRCFSEQAFWIKIHRTCENLTIMFFNIHRAPHWLWGWRPPSNLWSKGWRPALRILPGSSRSWLWIMTVATRPANDWTSSSYKIMNFHEIPWKNVYI